MSDESKLENYLERLEKALDPIPTSDRAEIIMEIKSHIHESKDRHPNKDIPEILDGLGEPESVANKYLIERELKPRKTSNKSIAKWLTIGFLGTFSILALSAIILIWKFTPIVSIDGDKGKVSILGDLISINDSDSTDSATHWSGTRQAESVVEKGSFSVEPGYKRVKILFSNVKANISWNTGDHVEWDCKIYATNSDIVKPSKSDIVLSLPTASKCQINIPSNLGLYLASSNGKISLDKPANDYEIDLTNGVVSITPDSSQAFSYDLRTVHGSIDEFKNTQNSGVARKAIVSVINGTIKQD